MTDSNVLEAVFFIRVEGDLELDAPRHHSLVLLPWGKPVGYKWITSMVLIEGGEEEELVPVRFDGLLPVPGPLELRLLAVHGGEVAHSMPNRPGETVRLKRNALRLERIFDGVYTNMSFRPRSKESSTTAAAGGKGQDTQLQAQHIPLGAGLLTMTIEPSGEVKPGAKTTALFVSALDPRGPISVQYYSWDPFPTDHYPWSFFGVPLVSEAGLRFQAVKRDGVVLEADNVRRDGVCIAAVFDCATDEIASFRFVEKALRTEIRFPVGELQFLPAENHGLDNLLDLRVPWPVRNRAGISDVVEGTHFPVSRYPSSRPDPGPTPPGATIREILDHFYPDYWQVRQGRLQYEKPQNLWTRFREAL